MSLKSRSLEDLASEISKLQKSADGTLAGSKTVQISLCVFDLVYRIFVDGSHSCLTDFVTMKLFNPKKRHLVPSFSFHSARCCVPAEQL